MNAKIAVIIAFILFFIFPCLFLGVTIGTLIPLYHKSSNLMTLKIGQEYPSFPPLGVAGLNLTFMKEDTQDTWYTVVLDLRASCNQTVNVTYAFFQPEFNTYQIMTSNMQGNGSLTEFGTESFKATYFAWNIFSKVSLHLETYDPYSFPFDIYETPNIIIAFDTHGSNATHRFILNGWELHSEIPSGFSTTISDYKELSENEIISELGNLSRLENSLALQFKITMLRNRESLLWLPIYILVPLLGLWSIFVINQYWLNLGERLKVFAGALLAIFAYLFTIRSFSPPTLTRIEVSIIELVGIWAFLELVRGFLKVLEKYELTMEKLKPVQKAVMGFKPIFLALLFTLITSILVFVNSFVFPALFDISVASGQTPWGIITSLFVHSGFEHLLVNMIGLLMFSALFLVTNFFLSVKEKTERSWFSLLVVFSMAILSNALWISLIPTISTAGSSGVVFALQGVVLGFSLLNSFGLKDIREVSGALRRKRLLAIYLFNLVIFITFFAQIVLEPSVFLNVATAVNVFVHGIAFLGAFLLSVLWHHLRKVSTKVRSSFTILNSKLQERQFLKKK